MLPFRRILFPVDYSAACQATIPYVQELVGRFSAEFTAIHAYGPGSAIEHAELSIIDPDLQIKAHAFETDRLRQFVCQAFQSRQVRCFAQLGEPGCVIDAIVRSERTDLVMLATRGHGIVRRFLLGSVVAKVLHDVGAAVWTGVGSALVDHPVQLPYRSIVCAVDSSEEAAPVLKAASCLSRAYSAQLSILHVVRTPPAYPDIDLDVQTKRNVEHANFALRELKAKLCIDAPHTVIDGALSDGIRNEVARSKADLLVTGRGQSAETFGRIWSHLYSIIRDSPCPVLSI